MAMLKTKIHEKDVSQSPHLRGFGVWRNGNPKFLMCRESGCKGRYKRNYITLYEKNKGYIYMYGVCRKCKSSTWTVPFSMAF